MDSSKEYNIAELLTRLLEGAADDSDTACLKEWLASEEGALEYYWDFVKDYTALKIKFESDINAESKLSQPNTYDQEIWAALADVEKRAPTIEIERPVENILEPISKNITVSNRKISKVSLFTFFFSAAAALLLFVLVLFSPIRPIVATITDSIDAEWIGKESLYIGDVVREGEMTLATGMAEITFGDGAVVIVEAPAIIELESPKSMFVSSGKISAVVSKYATGFTINTVSASIVDLGTEFGVSVAGNGSCSLHMFKGTASLIAGQKGQIRTSQIVSADQAKSVNLSSGNIQDIAMDRAGFVRRIDSEKGHVWRGENLSLADITGGGDGYGNNTSGVGVDPITGKISSRNTFLRRKVGNTFSLVEESSFVDSVFVPDGESEVIVDSDGNIFKECPDTNGQIFSPVTNVSENWGSDINTVKLYFDDTLDGLYGGKIKPAIAMDSNLGITYDLSEIRQSLGGIRLAGFKAVCGISSGVMERWNMNVKASIWVLVDGEVRFKAVDTDVLSGKHQINIELHENDRFLTLVATDSGDVGKGDANNHDSCFFGEPELVLH